MNRVSAVLLAAVVSGCASNISTENSVLATVCQATEKDLIAAVREVVSGMKNYSVRIASETEVAVKYDPKNPLMGSATVRVRALKASGVTKDGQRLEGAEILYKDVTPFLSQDSTFGGADIIAQLKSAFDDYSKFQGISCAQTRRQ